jgi:alkylated DNA repair protein (DNA oxidative demethylase)
MLQLGEDPQRGFHHPLLKPNRFHPKPKYPVSCYMGLGLYWDPLDYRYHPEHEGVPPWPLPDWLSDLCRRLVQEKFPHLSYRPEAALVNYYQSSQKMGWHVDKEEEDHMAPVIGLNFGSRCRFYFEDENGEEQSFLLPGNSVYLFGQSARLMRHAVGAPQKNSLSHESHGLLRPGERLNVTVRQVRRA